MTYLDFLALCLAFGLGTLFGVFLLGGAQWWSERQRERRNG